MPLDWNVGKVKDYKTLCFEPDPEDPTEQRVTVTTWKLIEATHFVVRMSSITEKNAEEFFRRLNLYETTFHTLRYRFTEGKREPLFYTLDEVKAHIGLYTNSSTKTKRQWERDFNAEKARHEQRKAEVA
jgi:hypothetical protein